MPEKKQRILVIDDEPSVSRYIHKLLKTENYEVVEINDPRKVEDHLLYAEYDLVITDLKMPGRSGMEILHLIRMSKPNLPVFMLTGHGSIETAVEATRLGVAEFITKPIEASGFIQSVHKHARANHNLPPELKRRHGRQRIHDMPMIDVVDGRVALENEIVSVDTVPEGFVEVRFDDVVPGEVLPFSIYIQVQHKGSGELFLRRICAKGTIFTSGLRNILFKRKLASVFIEERDYRNYIQFLTYLKSLPQFRGLRQLDDKKMLLYGKAVEAVADILAQPVDKGSVQAAVNMVDELFRSMVKNPELYEGMYHLFRQEATIFNHSANVCLLTVSFALNLNLMSASVKMLGLGALYHDMGLMMVDKKILEKPGTLNAEEWGQIMRHPDNGAEIMTKSSIFPGPAVRIIREHHESSDGKGYPKGLKQKQISGMTHLVRIVDKFEGMTTDKPYRKAFLPSEALKQIFKEETAPVVRGCCSVSSSFSAGSKTEIRPEDGEWRSAPKAPFPATRAEQGEASAWKRRPGITPPAWDRAGRR